MLYFSRGVGGSSKSIFNNIKYIIYKRNKGYENNSLDCDCNNNDLYPWYSIPNTASYIQIESGDIA